MRKDLFLPHLIRSAVLPVLVFIVSLVSTLLLRLLSFHAFGSPLRLFLSFSAFWRSVRLFLDLPTLWSPVLLLK
jgi:hypothetical protein